MIERSEELARNSLRYQAQETLDQTIHTYTQRKHTRGWRTGTQQLEAPDARSPGDTGISDRYIHT